MKAFLIYPHQLFEPLPNIKADMVIMIEDELFFNQYKFHKQKIAYHRATMRRYFDMLPQKKKLYIEAVDERCKTEQLFGFLSKEKIKEIEYFDTVDYLLERRIHRYCKKYNISQEKNESLNFLCSDEYVKKYFGTKKKYFFTAFYIDERKRHQIMLDSAGEPLGGKWTFDGENRNKMPKGVKIPSVPSIPASKYIDEAIAYTEKNFKANYGNLKQWHYPVDRESALKWLNDFLEKRFQNYGVYQDAIVPGEGTLFHSILTPMLNIGMISSKDILDASIQYGLKNNIPINSLEGFVRQVLGWREYIRAVYINKGVEERTKNFFKHKRSIPESFWNGTTGIAPIDDAVKRMNDSAYSHHIERLMVIGNFMVLCEFDPDEVYRWFMELFIDAYDWVMVPNVYGMSQFADGGIMSTKPYISGSNYILKMSNYTKAPWCEIWDGLFWNFIDKHRDFFLKNPRLSMMVRTFDKMEVGKREAHLKKADEYLKSLSTPAPKR
ncbi:MAG: cryptochrome/photolyase family protein [Flavobacteriales bacterium]|jgi:deoxyribodipyrimidine photolyase-related protein